VTPKTRDLITSLIGLWIVTGIFIDGWAHVHILNLIDTFFTPWHASFYSGLLAFAAWLFFLGLRLREPGESALQTLQKLPAGYRGGALGVAIFAIGGAADMLWHTLLGFEASIAALLSPPHLVLLTGVLLMGSTAWRSQRATSASPTVPELISLVSVVVISAFFLNYLSPFRWSAPSLVYVPDRGEDIVIMWIGGLLVMTAVLFVPTLWQLRDGRYRLGTLTVLTLAAGIGISVAMSDHWGLNVLIPAAIAAAIGAFVGEALLMQLPWRTWRYGLPFVCGLAAFAIWSFQLAAYAATAGVVWPVTLWGGALLFAGAAAAALASLVWRPNETPAVRLVADSAAAYQPDRGTVR
jgi:hypothetical protein